MRRRLQLATIGLVVSLAALAFASTASAQVFSSANYEALANECADFLTQARQAQDEGDQGRALVYLDLATESCRDARAMVAGVEAVMSDRERQQLFVESFERDARIIELLIDLGSCREALDLMSMTSRLVEELPLPAVDLYAATAASVLHCLPETIGAATEVAITTGMSEVWYSGTAVGMVPAESFSPGCAGYLPESPSFHIEVAEVGTVTMQALSEGSDLVLLLTGAGGTYCNDDFNGGDPAISEWLPAGRYDVYVGEYSASGYGSVYTLGFSTDPLATAGVSAATYGDVALGPGDEPVRLTGYSYAYEDAASVFGAACVGYVTETPSYTLRLSDATEVWIGAFAEWSDYSDLTLVVSGPGGTFCDNDSMGLNPVVHEALAAGSYDVYVGELAPWGSSYIVHFATSDPGVASVGGPPSGGTVTLSPTGPPQVVHGTSRGLLPAPTRLEPHCMGFIDSVPNFDLEVTGEAEYGITVDSLSDTTLAVVGAQGTFCNNDWGGRNPAVFQRLQAGSYRVYVGVWGSEADFEIRFTPDVR